jgi:hypothetical protein
MTKYELDAAEFDGLDLSNEVVPKSSQVCLTSLADGCFLNSSWDAPYERGRLIVSSLGAGQFTFDVVQRMREDSARRGHDTFR